MRAFFKPNLYIVLFSLLVALVAGAAAQEMPPTLSNRTLTGSVNIGDVGRYVGLPQLGTLTVTGDDLAADAAHSIQLNSNGFAWLPNGILLRNGSDTDLSFDGPNQSHDFEVYYFGDSGRSDSSVARQDLGDFSIDSLGATNTDTVTLATGDRRTTFGGYWDQLGVYEREDGSRAATQFLPRSSGTSPITLTEGDFSENNGGLQPN